MENLNTQEMFYDDTTSRYILTPKGVLNNLGENLETRLNKRRANNDENVAQNILNQISFEVYSYIYAHTQYPSFIEKVIKYDDQAKKIVKDAMLQQVAYTLVNGSLNLHSGVDIRKGSKMEGFYDRSIAPLAKMTLDRTVDFLGVPLTYTGTLSFIRDYNFEEKKNG